MVSTQVPPPANTPSGAPPGTVNAAHGGVCLPGNAPNAVELLRWGFAAHGFDSSSYSDTEVSAAVLAEAHPELRSRRDLYTRAFARLRNARTEGGVSPPVAFPKSSVKLAMTLIRPLFEQCDRDVSSYTDDQIAEALLWTHPYPAAQWLSHEHVSCASAQLTPTSPIRTRAPSRKSGKGAR